MTQYSIVFLIGYVLGSISFAYLIGKSKGINILKEGSGSAGATNIKRVMGRFWGNIVFILDFTKGVIVTALPALIFSTSDNLTLMCIIGLLGGIIGHSFSLFLKFKGGKGIATTMGGLVVLAPLAFAIGVGVWLIVFYTTRYVSVASMTFALSLPISAYCLDAPRSIVHFCFLIMALTLLFHHKNIRRLLLGTENKFSVNR